MVGNRHNFVIGFLGIVVFAVVVAIVIKQNKNEEKVGVASLGLDIQVNEVPNVPNVPNKKGLKNFYQSLELMVQCLKLPPQDIAKETPPVIESIVLLLQGPMGPVVGTSDRWLEWILLTREKKNKKYRLEITETDEGKIGRELHAFVGALNTWNPEDISDDISNNPNDQIIEDLLKEGEVVSKSKAGVSLFPNGSRLEFIEVNGELEQIEIFDEDNQFGCKDIRSPETCICN